jgi:hypothetical protein
VKNSKRQIRLSEYRSQLLGNKKLEDFIEKDEEIINGMTSPNSATSTEELRIFMDFMDRANTLSVSKYDTKNRKSITLRKFLKSKRNQQVVIRSRRMGKEIRTEGKVSAIGRDFVMLTNVFERIWIPFRSIDSANVPYDVPNYSGSYQHFIYDNDLRKKLVQNFGKVVSNREVLKQQFFEESLYTNLLSWKGTRVELMIDDNRFIGKIDQLTKNEISLLTRNGFITVPIIDVQYIHKISYIQKATNYVKTLKNLKT